MQLGDLDIHLVAHGSAEYEETVALRDAVLRQPLGLVFAPEQLGAETDDLHLACYHNGDLVACLILTHVDADHVKMRQVAVAPPMQGRGIGGALVRASEQVARERGYGTMQLNARDTAVPFYRSLGYESVGGMFEEVTIPHQAMRKNLR